MNKKNAGFSLVELIVVIAIMAVLVGVLAPAYLRYVEKSRKSSDVSAVDEMLKAADTVTSDTQFDVPGGATYTLSGASGKITMAYGAAGAALEVFADDGTDDVLTEWKSVANMSDGEYKLRSKEFSGKSGEATGTVQDDGTVKWEATGDLFEAMNKHSKDLGKKIGYSAGE